VQDVENSHWIHLSQDTIRNGTPGKREAVEEAAREALRHHNSVVIDRTHLDPEQRRHFIQLAQASNVPVHAVVLHVSRSELIQRVRDRIDHPAGVQGDKFVKLAVRSLEIIKTPTYEEGLALISIAASTDAANALADVYRRINGGVLTIPLSARPCMYHKKDESTHVLPSIAMGTYKLGKRVTASMLTLAATNGIQAVDTAPTYNNEESIGDAICADTFLIVKVPKRATQPAQVRTEVLNSLRKLKRDTSDLVLLHWPCDFIQAGSLEAVWKELEQMKSEGYCRNLGVSNFSVGALRTLLPLCKVERPVVNQVERHPLLPQWKLLDFCTNNDILLQAHTPLGQGKSKLLEHATVARIAETNNRTAAQVVLQWNLGQGVAVVPKCSSESHVLELAGVATGAGLTPVQMEELDAIGSKASDQQRFVEPPFMYKAGASYSWGDLVPSKGN
jgi:diketogulonate reductase-like aldo/keto reductase